MCRKNLLFFIILLLYSIFPFSSAQAQIKEIEKKDKKYSAVLDTNSRNKRVVTFALPYLGYDPETSLSFGFNTSSVFKTDTLTNRYSSIYSNIGYSLKKQLTIILSHSIFTKKEKWFIKGRLNYLNFPLTIYEIGNRTPSESAERINSSGFLFYQKIMRKFGKYLFFGFQYRYHTLSQIEAQDETAWFAQNQPLGFEEFKISGFGSSFKVDTRDNNQSSKKGLFANVSYYNYSSKLKSSYNFSTLDIDLRIFTKPFKEKKTILAFWLYNSFSQGDVVWKELPQTGIYGTTRGYVKGRYRSDYFLAYELEVRTHIWDRLWGVAFSGISTVSENTELPEYWNPSVGFGFRYLLKSKEQLYTGFDFAWGNNKNRGIYARLGQAF